MVEADEGASLPPQKQGRSPVVAGLVAAAVTLLLLVGWKLFAGWYIFGSAATDLPGQNSSALVSRLEIGVFCVITLAGGRVAGLLCGARRAIAALIGVSPMLLPALLIPLGFGQTLQAAALGTLVCFVALLGAYAPGWLSRR